MKASFAIKILPIMQKISIIRVILASELCLIKRVESFLCICSESLEPELRLLRRLSIFPIFKMSDKILDESYYLNRCCQLIEDDWQNGKSKHWRDSDYKALSTLISEKSHISISTDTLKRLFGKIKTFRNYNPQAETKNALAIFLDFKDWNEFKESSLIVSPIYKIIEVPKYEISENISSSKPIQPLENTPQKKKKWFIISILGSIVLCAIVVLYFIFNSKKQKTFSDLSSTDNVAFTGKFLNGVAPHTVVFQYDITSIHSDSVYIDYGHNDFENIERELLPKNKHTITHYYHNPGMYKVRLWEGQKVISTLAVEVISNSWKNYVYLRNKEVATIDDRLFTKNYNQSRAFISFPQIQSAGIDVNQINWVEFCNFQDFKVDGDEFIFETRFKNNKNEGGTDCLESIIKLMGQDGTLRVQFNKPGCARWAIVQFGEKELDGKYTDLYPFSTDVSTWRTVRIENIHKKVKVFLDNTLIYSVLYEKPISKLKGIVYNFRGCGSVDYIRLYDATNKVVFEEEFDK